MPQNKPYYVRRIASLIYDGLVLIALLMLVTLLLLPFTNGQAIPAGTLSYQLSLLCAVYVYFVAFWQWHGQTIGMKTWGIKLSSKDFNQPPTFRVANRRFLWGLFSILSAGVGLICLNRLSHCTISKIDETT